MGRAFIVSNVQGQKEKTGLFSFLGLSKSKSDVTGDIIKASNPSGAASKALFKQCKMLNKAQKTKGVCSFKISLKEIETNPSGEPKMRSGNVIYLDKNEYKYRVRRRKYEKPVEIADGVVFKYRSEVKPIKS